MTTERKWKQGDIGPDGRAFYKYHKQSKNGEWWVTPEKFNEYKEKDGKRARKYYAANHEKLRERRRKNYAANPQKFRIEALERYRIRHAANPEKFRERYRIRHAANPEKFREKYRKKYARKRNQAAADQFFIMAGAAESISQTLSNQTNQ